MTTETQTDTPPTHNAALAVADRFAAQLLRAALDALANQRTLWPITPQQQQQEVIDRLRNAFTEVIVRQMSALAAAGLPYSEVGLNTITAKGETIKAVVTVGDNKTLHELVDAIGRKVVLVLVDAEVYTAGMESFEAQADQPELPLEEPSGDGTQAAPVRCTCPAGTNAPSASHEPDCELINDLARFEAQARAEAEAFRQRASGVIDGRSERVKHQDRAKGPQAPKFPKPDATPDSGEAA